MIGHDLTLSDGGGTLRVPSSSCAATSRAVPMRESESIMVGTSRKIRARSVIRVAVRRSRPPRADFSRE